MPDRRARDNHWQGFEGQTRLKHYVLDAYLAVWSRVLIQSGHRQLWFVDAFAGRGQDQSGKPGSPLIARDIAKKVETDFPGATIRIVAIEADHDNFVELTRALGPDCGPDGCVTALEGELTNHVEEVMTLVGSNPALFFLDPWGVKGVKAEIAERLLRDEKREVLVLFDDDGAARVQAAASAPIRVKTELSANMSLFEDEYMNDTPSRRTQSEESRARSAKATEEVLREMFGPRWEQVQSRIKGLSGVSRRDALLREALLSEYGELLRDLKATHVLPFAVKDERDRHHYYLVHASRHKKAFTTMKGAIRSALNKRDAEPDARPTLFFESGADIEAAANTIVDHFAGKEVRWQGKIAETVQAFAAEYTQLLYGDMKALKVVLQRRGYVTNARPLTYAFPVKA